MRPKRISILLGVGRGAGVEVAQHERQGSVDWKPRYGRLNCRRMRIRNLSDHHGNQGRNWTVSVTTIKEIKGELS